MVLIGFITVPDSNVYMGGIGFNMASGSRPSISVVELGPPTFV